MCTFGAREGGKGRGEAGEGSNLCQDADPRWVRLGSISAWWLLTVTSPYHQSGWLSDRPVSTSNNIQLSVIKVEDGYDGGYPGGHRDVEAVVSTMGSLRSWWWWRAWWLLEAETLSWERELHQVWLSQSAQDTGGHWRTLEDSGGQWERGEGRLQDAAQAMIVQTQFLSSFQDVCVDIAARTHTIAFILAPPPPPHHLFCDIYSLEGKITKDWLKWSFSIESVLHRFYLIDNFILDIRLNASSFHHE